MRRSLIPLLCVSIAACGAPAPESVEPAAEPVERPEPPPRAAGPYIRVVGTAQDGGLPHVGCTCDRCERARREPGFRRLVASLAVVLPESGAVFLIDATPDVALQLETLADVRDAPAGRVDRAPLDGVFLTHAHIGHYLGLALFGYEAVHTQGMPVYGTPRMLSYLEDNGPWSQLITFGNIEPRELAAGTSVEIGDGVTVSAIAVPHRDEYADTVGFVIAGPTRRVLYVPDTDSWNAWEPSIEEVLAGVDVGLLDGTFFSADELPGRSTDEIGHPLIAGSLERLAPVVAGGKRIAFTHLNHSNLALEPNSTARARVEQLGFEILDDGDEIGL